MTSIKETSFTYNGPGIKALATSWSAIAILTVALAAVTLSRDQFVPSGSSSSEEDFSNSLLASLRHLQESYTFDEHVPLFPLTSNDYTGFLCAICGLMVAAGGGIGGGGILVPIYILVMGFAPKNAIPLSNITVFGGAVANTWLNASKRHPLADRPLVDWDLILIMEPLTIAGALMGAFLNKLLREEILVVMLVLLLSFTAYNTLKKAIKMYKIESATMMTRLKESELTTIVHNDNQGGEVEAEDDLLKNAEDQGDGDATYNNMDTVDSAENEELMKIMDEERFSSKSNITTLVVMFVVVLFINVMKGGGAFPSPLGIECGSTAFWASNVLMVTWILLISYKARLYLVNRYFQKENCGYKYVEGDIKWDQRSTIIYPAICALAGFFAGMFGVGGGIVKGPLMLAMGVHPKVSSASSACMILFTSFTATTSFVVFGLLIHDYALICLFIGFVATYFGQIALYYLMSKYERNSYIAFSIGGVVLLSAFLMTIQSLVSMAEGGGKHASGICGVEG